MFLLLFICGNSFFSSITYGQNDPEQIAKEYFKNKEYQLALPLFKDLAELYPKDAHLNYYYAACLVENKIFNEDTKAAIKIASDDNIPEKVLFYHGQIYHAENNFEEATNLYNQFLKEAKRKVVKETNIEELLNLAEERINPFSVQIEEVVEEISELSDTTELAAEVIEEEIEPFKIPSHLKDSLFYFQVTPSIHYLKISQFKNKSSIELFVKGWLIEQDVDKLVNKANTLRNNYARANEEQKITLTEEILQIEKETYKLNQQLNEQYLKARGKEISYWDKANASEISDFQRKISILEDSIANATKVEETKEAEHGLLLEIPENIDEEIIPEVVQPVTHGVVYKIQIGAYRKTPPTWVQQLFKKLSVIRKIDNYTDEKGITVYTVGELTSFQDALQMQAQLRQEGVKDAFVAAYKDGERIPVNEAKKLTE